MASSNGSSSGSSSDRSTQVTTPPPANVETSEPRQRPASEEAPGAPLYLDAAAATDLRTHLSRFVDHATTLDDNTKSLGQVIDRRVEHRMRKAEAIFPSMEPNLEFDELDRAVLFEDDATPEWVKDDEAPKQWKEYTGKQLQEDAHLERSSQWSLGRSCRPREKGKSRFFPKP